MEQERAVKAAASEEFKGGHGLHLSTSITSASCGDNLCSKREDTASQVAGEPKLLQMNSPRSIIPESTKEFPSRRRKDLWTTVPLPGSRVRYNIYNPIGPRWYKNHHLIPPSETRATARPPTVFSSSFPPITTSTSSEFRDDAIPIPGPSRTQSHSPVPTPSSSQTRVVDPYGKPRSRKNSETAHDNVDLMDVTDPWGTNWHHQSPYDVGLWNEPVSVDVRGGVRTRSASMTTIQARQSNLFPSSVSQSTSAVHLNTSSNIVVHSPRKLSKRRTPTVNDTSSAFQGKITSSPIVSLEPSGTLNPLVLPSMLPLSSLDNSTTKKEKRGSILDRLVKKFGKWKRVSLNDRPGSRNEIEWPPANNFDAMGDLGPQHDMYADVRASLNKAHSGYSDHPAQVQTEDEHFSTTNENVDTVHADDTSAISVEAPYSIGRLTVANPDVPDSNDGTPTAPRECPLSPDIGSVDFDFIRAVIDLPSPISLAPKMSGLHQDQSPGTAKSPEIRQGTDASAAVTSSKHGYPLVPEKDNVNQTSSILSHSSQQRRFKSTSIHGGQVSSSPVAASSKKRSEHHVSDSPKKPPPVPEKTKQPSPLPPIPFPSSENPESLSEVTWSQSSVGEAARYSTSSILANPPTPHSDDSNIPQLHTHDRTSTSYGYSPLSVSSVIVNPPTPHTSDASMPKLNRSSSPPRRKAPRENMSPKEPNSGQTHRQTETFRLVRSPSGHIYSASETIVAGGQHWGLKETSENKSSSKTAVKPKEKDKESQEKLSRNQRTTGRRERKHASRSQVEPEKVQNSRRDSRSHRTDKAKSTDRESASTLVSPRPGMDASSSRVPQELRKSVQKSEEDKGGKPEPKPVDAISLAVNKPQHQPPTSTAPSSGGQAAVSVERRPSQSTRPTSQLPSAAELTAVRAKEAWDMERLLKARSMNGDEVNGYRPSPPISGPTETLSSGDRRLNGVIHGSGHTASPQSSVPNTTARSQPKQKHSSPSMARAKPRTSTRSSVVNPLPEPPRESSYEPVPLSLPGGNRRSGDYWAKLAGVSIPH